jgi:azurin
MQRIAAKVEIVLLFLSEKRFNIVSTPMWAPALIPHAAPKNIIQAKEITVNSRAQGKFDFNTYLTKTLTKLTIVIAAIKDAIKYSSNFGKNLVIKTSPDKIIYLSGEIESIYFFSL